MRYWEEIYNNNPQKEGYLELLFKLAYVKGTPIEREIERAFIIETEGKKFDKENLYGLAEYFENFDKLKDMEKYAKTLEIRMALAKARRNYYDAKI